MPFELAIRRGRRSEIEMFATTMLDFMSAKMDVNVDEKTNIKVIIFKLVIT